MKNKVQISASIMCADLFHLEKDLNELKMCGTEYLHLDIMDGIFVDNITLGFDCCKRIESYGIARDVHLLVQYPARYVERLALHEGDIFQFHYEADVNIHQIAEMVHKTGAKVGVVLNPETAVDVLAPYIDEIDVITLMMIKPGHAGQPMEAGMLEKISTVAQWVKKLTSREILLEIDGHVNTRNVPEMSRNGASIVVAGTSSIFRSDITITEGIHLLRTCVDGVERNG